MQFDAIKKKVISLNHRNNWRNIKDNEGDVKLFLVQRSQGTVYACLYLKSYERRRKRFVMFCHNMPFGMIEFTPIQINNGCKTLCSRLFRWRVRIPFARL